MVLSLSVRTQFIAPLITLVAALIVVAPRTCLAETVLLDFSLPKCGPCQQMRPVVQRLLADGLPVREVDVSREPHLATQYGVTEVPTFLVVTDGRVVDRSNGITSYAQLHRMLRNALPLPAPRQPARLLGQSPSRPSASAANPLHQRLLAATVKIAVDDAQGKSAGTGTIVDARQGEALILTCGHLFRTSGGKGPITVTTFQSDATRAIPGATYSGRLIDFDLERDLALVSIRPTTPVQAVSIAAAQARRLLPSAAVTSVGCNHGQNPTAIDSHVTSIDRYEGTPNVEVAGAPVEGRSGGGLFNTEGQLIGVCYAADRQSNEGLYVSLPAIYAKLDSLGFTKIYQAGTSAPQIAHAAPASAIASQPLMAVRGQEPEPPQFSAHTQTVPPGIGALAPAEQAALEEIQRRGANSEVICIIRPHDPLGKSEVITINNASPAFVRALANPTAHPSTAAATSQLLR